MPAPGGEAGPSLGRRVFRWWWDRDDDKEPRSRRRPIGVVEAAMAAGDLDSRLAELGDAGRIARELDAATEANMAGITSLSALSADLAVTYLERISRPLKELTLESGVEVVTRGYAAHLAVEADPGAFGAVDIPVLGTLPPLRGGRPPQDLLTRAVKATRRGFEGIRAVDSGVWDGFVACTVRRVHERAAGRFAAPAVVDGLVRLGWVLRQVDIHYGQQPERR